MAQRNTVQIIINAKDDASSVLSGVGDALAGVGKFALGAVAAVGVAAVGIGAAVVKLAADAAPLQGISAAFEGLAESASIGADDMLSALERGSAGMISQRELMTSFNKAAQLVSVDFAQTLPDAMGSLGKVAAATGEDMGFLLDSLVVGVGRLSPMILDNLGIQVSLTEAYDDWATANGVAVEEMTKTQQQAALTAQVMTKLADNTAAMPDVAGSAAAGMAQMSATFQNVKDQVGLAFVPALTGLMQVLSTIGERVLPPFVEFIENSFAPAVEMAAFFVESFVAALMAGVGPIDAFLGALRDVGLDDVADQLSNVKLAIQGIVDLAVKGDFTKEFGQAFGVFEDDPIVEKLFNVRDTVIDTFNKITSWVKTNWPIFKETIISTFDAVTAWVRDNWPAFKETVLATVDEIKAWFETNWPIIQAVALTAWEVIRDIALTVVGIFQDQIVPAFESAFDELTAALDVLGIDWGDVWNAIKLALKIVAAAIGAIIVGIIAVFTGLATAIAGVVEFVSSTFNSLVGNIRQAWEGIAGVIIGGFNIIKGIFAGDTELIRAGFATWWEGMQNLVSGWLGAIVDTFKLAFGTIIVFVSEFIEGVVTFFTDLFDRLVGNSIITDMMSDMLSIITEKLGAILEGFVTIFNRVVNRVRSKMREIKNAISDKINEARNWVEGQVAAWVSVGTALMQGLVDGILSQLNAVVEAITSLINDAISAALALLGIESPSKVFADIGRNISKGLAFGIEDSFDLAIAAFLKEAKKLKLTAEEIAAGTVKIFNDIMIGGMLQAAQAFGSLGGAAVAILQSRTVDPLTDQIDAMNESILGLEDALSGIRAVGNQDILDLSVEQLQELMQAILNPRPIPGGGIPQINQELLDAVESALILRDLEEDRAAAAFQVLEAEQAIAALQRQQENLAFLQQQINLLDLIAERGLDAGAILGGLALGIDADALAVAQAMAAAMAEIIAQTEAQLGIASPSRVFQNIGAQLMLGLAQGVRDAEFIPQQAAADATGAMIQTVNNNTVNMTVNTQASTSNVMADMQSARAMLGV